MSHLPTQAPVFANRIKQDMYIHRSRLTSVWRYLNNRSPPVNHHIKLPGIIREISIFLCTRATKKSIVFLRKVMVKSNNYFQIDRVLFGFKITYCCIERVLFHISFKYFFNTVYATSLEIYWF